jgi:hypothetical protein
MKAYDRSKQSGRKISSKKRIRKALLLIREHSALSFIAQSLQTRAPCSIYFNNLTRDFPFRRRSSCFTLHFHGSRIDISLLSRSNQATTFEFFSLSSPFFSSVNKVHFYISPGTWLLIVIKFITCTHPCVKWRFCVVAFCLAP